MYMYKFNRACRICKSKRLTKFLDFGRQPLANSFIKERSDFAREKKYPLAVFFCHDCNLVQLRHVVDKKELFSEYIYFTSGMPRISNHFREYAQDVIERFLEPDDFVIEIASNDGILLKFFKDNNFRILGIDPAANIAKVAESLGVKTDVAFFSQKKAVEILKKHGQAKVILANNVVAHINDHHDLAAGINVLLDKDGVFIFEAPYLVDMFQNLTYDTIYHEHLSFLAVRPLIHLFGQFYLEFFDIEIHPVQGQSIRGFVCRQGTRPISPRVKKLVDLELKMGFNKVNTYKELAKKIKAQKNNLVGILKALKKKGHNIAAYGAPAKGNTMLNFCKIDNKMIDYAIEDLPVKQNLYTPGMHIPTISRAQAEDKLPDYFLMLAWNYSKAILEKEKNFLKQGGKFIIPVKNIEIK